MVPNHAEKYDLTSHSNKLINDYMKYIVSTDGTKI